jgi:hypothetical protein
MPYNKEELMKCHGIAEKRYMNFGSEILHVVKNYRRTKSREQSSAQAILASLTVGGVSAGDEVVVGETLSCLELVNRKFQDAKENGYVISI